MAKKKTGGLGRGLDALLGAPAYDSASADTAPVVTSEQDEMLENVEEASNPESESDRDSIEVQEDSEDSEVKEDEEHTFELEPKNAPVIQRPAEIRRPYDNENSTVTYRSVRRIPNELPKVPEVPVKTSEEPQETRRAVHETNEIPLDSITPNPDQPRTNFNQDELEELASSIEKDGLLQPILVRPKGKDAYEIIAGERRWQACKKLGLKTVPVRIREADDTAALELALIENIQRSDLNPIEEAYGYRRIMERRKVTQSELAQMVSKGRSTIANALRLLDLPEDAQQLLFEEKITAGHARAILSIPSAEGKNELTKKLVSEKLSVRETENLARLIVGREKGKESASVRTPTPKEYKMVARKLKDHLDASVKVKSVQGKNKIEIEFADLEDLERIYLLIAPE